MTKPVWPDDFDLKDVPDIEGRVTTFITMQMAVLKTFDKKRQEWVKDNLPPFYRMTYFFHDHAYRVAEDIRKTALHMGLSSLAAENLYRAMLPHDIGKSLLPLHIWDTIEKPENAIKMLRRSHTELGVGIIAEVLGNISHPFIDLMADIMMNHHEQMDGNGFLHKKGADISAPARLACIVESFDGYSISRHHFGDRDISVEGVLKRMREEKGAAIYDMDLFEAFADMKISEYKENRKEERGTIKMQAFKKLIAIAAPLPMANIDTDMIIPKQFLRSIKRTGFGINLFNDMRYDGQGEENPDFVLNKKPYRAAEILIAGDNFGCGSSREHAPWALLDFGIRCILATSYADIFYNNCFKNGILPVQLLQEEIDILMDRAQQFPSEPLCIDLEKQEVTAGNNIFAFEIEPFRKQCLLEGLDDIGLTLAKEKMIAAYEEKNRRNKSWLWS